MRCAAAVILLCAISAEAQHTFTGTVVDADSHQPIAGARVVAELRLKPRDLHSEVLVVLTDKDGRFVLTGLPQCTGSISVEKPGYSTPIRKLGISIPTADKAPAIELKSRGILIVHVVDLAGTPLDGAQIAAFPRAPSWQGGSGISTPKGARLEVEAGFYRVAAISPGFATLLRATGRTFRPTYYPASTDESQAAWVEAVHGKPTEITIRITPLPGREIRGRFASGKAMQILLRSAEKATGTVDVNFETGEFRIAGLPPGTYEISSYPYSKTVRVDDHDVEVVITESDRLPGR